MLRGDSKQPLTPSLHARHLSTAPTPLRHLKRPPLPRQPISARAEVTRAALRAAEGLHQLRGRLGQDMAAGEAPRSASRPPWGPSARLSPLPARRSASRVPPPAPLGFSPRLVLTPSALRPPPPALPRIPPTRRESSRPPRRSGRCAPRPRRTAPRSLPPSWEEEEEEEEAARLPQCSRPATASSGRGCGSPPGAPLRRTGSEEGPKCGASPSPQRRGHGGRCRSALPAACGARGSLRGLSRRAGFGGGAVPPGLPLPPALQPHGGGVGVQRLATFVRALLREGALGGRAEFRRGSGH